VSFQSEKCSKYKGHERKSALIARIDPVLFLKAFYEQKSQAVFLRLSSTFL
jgi:hypothetical protein